MRKWLYYLGTIVLLGFLVQQMVTTYYLAKIDGGLHSSLRSTARLGTIQTEIIHKNQSLHNVLAATQDISGQLQLTLKETQIIDGNIHQIDNLNLATLRVNQVLTGLGSQGQNTLGAIAASMQTLQQKISSLSGPLSQLDDTIHSDRSLLHDMRAQTDRMNAKVPGVLP